MNNNEMYNGFSDRRLKVLIVLAVLLIGWLCIEGSRAAHAQAAPATISPNLQEVIKLSKAHMTDGVILAFIHNSGIAYNLSADDVLSLNSQGVSQSVISALIQSKAVVLLPAPAPMPAPSYPAPAQQYASPPPSSMNPPGEPSTPAPAISEAPMAGSEVTLPYFQSQLTPYGTWADIPGNGLCWIPSAQATTPDWRPYFTGGHWEYTEQGWFWRSDYPWGQYAFHYGRWFRDARYGWAWVPGYHWGPGWVCWRNAEDAGFCGWAPLPPSARFEVGVGLVWNGRVAVDTDFGLGVDMFCFVPFDHFWAHDYRAWAVPSWRRGELYHHSMISSHYGFVGGHVFVGGIGRERIGVLTHHDVPMARIEIRDSRIVHEREIQRDRSVQVGRGGQGIGHEIGHGGGHDSGRDSGHGSFRDDHRGR